MSETAQRLENIIVQSLPGATVAVDAVRPDGNDFYILHVSASQFEGKTRVDQHRMVYKCLQHAGFNDFDILNLRTFITPPQR